MTTTNRFDTCIIVVNYNGWEDTIECLNSVFGMEEDNFRVIVVDNGSINNSWQQINNWAAGNVSPYLPPNSFHRSHLIKDDRKVSYQLLEEPYSKQCNELPELTLIRSARNGGFSYGNNVAINYVNNYEDWKYLWLLNNDTVIDKGALGALIDCYQQANHTGLKMVGSKLLYYHQPHRIQCIGGARYSPWSAKAYQVGSGEVDHGQYHAQNVSLDYISGASLLVSRSFVEQVGLLEESYFLYFEEIDWTQRAKRIGSCALIYCENSLVYHKEGASTGGSIEKSSFSAISEFYQLRNRIWITYRYFREFLPAVYFVLGLTVLKRLGQRQWKRALSILKTMTKPSREYFQKP